MAGRVIGLFAALLLLFVAWASLFEIDEAVRATGELMPEARTQIIESANGGQIEVLHVQEGQAVTKGDPLVELSPEQAEARWEQINAQIRALEVARVRAQAEAAQRTPDFGEFTGNLLPVVAAERALFRQHLAEQETEVALLQEEMQLAQEDYELLLRLAGSGDVSERELMRSERDLIGAKRALEAAESKYKTRALEEVADIERKLAELRFTLSERESVLRNTVLRAPRNGIVSKIDVFTIGATLRAGDQVMTISPTGDRQILRANIRPQDVGRLRKDLPAAIRLDAFDSSIYGSYTGTVRLVSADAVTERTASGREETFYEALIDVDFSSNSKIPQDLLRSGMTATIDITTGRRTVLSFILKPVLRGFDGALIEQ